MHSDAYGKYANKGEPQVVLGYLRVDQRRKQEDKVDQEKGNDLIHYLKSVHKPFFEGLVQNDVAT